MKKAPTYLGTLEAESEALAAKLLASDRSMSAEAFSEYCHKANLSGGHVRALREAVWAIYEQNR